MSITYNEINNYLTAARIRDLSFTLKRLHDLIIEGRDRPENPIPVSLTKYRIKNSDSIYLKTKRKKIESLDNITDYAGLRVLCLFETDILPIHRYLLECFRNNGYSLIENTIFNWDESHDFNVFSNELTQIFPSITLVAKKRPSGYKSVHYVVTISIGDKPFPIEVQLRTLLQDVWGELEHSLSYKKGSIHPHIRKSFKLLAADLATKDQLVTHLKDISDKERCSEKYQNEKTGPRSVFGYEDSLVPQIFKEEGALSAAYSAYWAHMQSYKPNVKQEWKDTAIELYNNIVNNEALRGSDSKNPEVAYMLAMEDAFLKFSLFQHDDALAVYQNLLSKHRKYVVLFRMGEIYMLNGNIESALNAFDESETLLSSQAEINYLNLYKIKSRLALTYWLLGDEYIDIAIEKIDEAKNIFAKCEEKDCTEKDAAILTNNISWYYLGKFTITNDEADFNIAKDKFEDLEKTINKESNSNALDTAAWFCYHAYKKTSDETYLKKAKNYCTQMGERVNYTSYNFRSMNIHINHIQEIMNAK